MSYFRKGGRRSFGSETFLQQLWKVNGLQKLNEITKKHFHQVKCSEVH
jgi:hypothetical protein